MHACARTRACAGAQVPTRCLWKSEGTFGVHFLFPPFYNRGIVFLLSLPGWLSQELLGILLSLVPISLWEHWGPDTHDFCMDSGIQIWVLPLVHRSIPSDTPPLPEVMSPDTHRDWLAPVCEHFLLHRSSPALSFTLQHPEFPCHALSYGCSKPSHRSCYMTLHAAGLWPPTQTLGLPSS